MENQSTSVAAKKQQKIIVKKLLTHSSSKYPISEGPTSEPGNVEIPEGWTVKQIATSPLDCKGESRYLAVTLLLEKDE